MVVKQIAAVNSQNNLVYMLHLFKVNVEKVVTEKSPAKTRACIY